MTTLSEHLLVDSAPAIVPVHVIASDAEALQAARDFAVYASLDAVGRDCERRLPWAEIERFTASGLGGITTPLAYGGAEVSHVTLAEVFKIICQADPALGQIPQNHFGVLSVVRHVAEPAQQQQLFQSILKGCRIGNGGAERGTRNTLDIRTVAHREADGSYRIKGEKFYSTGALFAHWVSIKALDDNGKTVMAFIERGTQGLRIVDDWSGFGQRTTASGTVLLDDVSVPAKQVVPFYRLDQSANIQGSVSQLIQAAIDAGIAHAAVAEAITFVRDRGWSSRDAHVEQTLTEARIMVEIAKLQIELLAADALLERAARTLDEVARQPLDDAAAARASVAVAEAKVITTEISLLASEKLFELAGHGATRTELNLDRHWRNARTHTVHDPVRWQVHAVGNYHLNGA
nr:SfnB family sulfur acquisition oxidoreductase [Pseudomonas syringae group genomosp. 3]